MSFFNEKDNIIVAKKPIWMSFFDEKDNILQAEHTCAILLRIFEIFVLVE
jgi:hypothetical protein